MSAQFTALSAAADYLGNGAVFVPEFQSEITDIIRRAGVLGQRINYVPTLGSPARWLDQTAIADGQFTDPRTITPTSTSPTRVEKSALIKAVTNRIDYSIFDLEVYAQQGSLFGQLKSKDLHDMLVGMTRLRDKALWNGNDTMSGSQVGAGTTTQYVGLLNQISKNTVIASGQSIIDNIRTQVAQLVADANYDFRPTGIYVNPLLLDYIEQEAKNSQNAMRYIASNFTEVKVGLSVQGIYTAAGLLPLIPEPFLAMDATIPGVAAAPNGQHNYPFAIVQEDLIDFLYVTSKDPRVFMLGRQSGLQESFVGIQFGAPVVKMSDKAHVLGVVQR